MNCEQCQELISVYLDNELEAKDSMSVQTHLALCAGCAKVCEDFAAILDFCETDDFLPPNPKALWCRINNIIETEVKAEFQLENTEQQVKKDLFARVFRNPWQFSFSQVASLVLGIALVSSLLTVIGVKNFYSASGDYATNAAPSVFEKVLGKFGLVETFQQVRERRIKEQQARIEYWNKRVETRRANWERHLREAFDRNLNEIDQVVFEYDKILQENPQDELSGEMLDSALDEKVELLRQFSEL
ncbi:MAG: zf-HC2 domain-containing protein [Acidobacteria bacterium]|nr:zf-HC2 domain-containing protein [Acidobacteriota bacterium]MCA1637097.1 zf-HC2 domain-containing protein [Acidobacteriota bacterium]